VLRPTRIFGIGFGALANLLHFVAFYAAICKELGHPLAYPGSQMAYRTLLEMTDAGLLAEASVWAATAATARDQVFNITNGDLFRWSQLWPAIADFFGLELAPPMPLDLKLTLADQAPLWREMARKYGLVDTPYEELVNWERASRLLNWETEAHSSTIKIRQAGFHSCLDTRDNFIAKLTAMRKRRLIP
jgi:nucleoside-diphosphate-sugar epimerase